MLAVTCSLLVLGVPSRATTIPNKPDLKINKAAPLVPVSHRLDYPHRVIGILRPFNVANDESVWACTAFLVGPDLVATAAHCVQLAELSGTTLEWRFLVDPLVAELLEPDFTGGNGFAVLPPVPWRSGGTEPLVAGKLVNPYDWAILRLQYRLGDYLGYFGERNADGSIRAGDPGSLPNRTTFRDGDCRVANPEVPGANRSTDPLNVLLASTAEQMPPEILSAPGRWFELEDPRPDTRVCAAGYAFYNLETLDREEPVLYNTTCSLIGIEGNQIRSDCSGGSGMSGGPLFFFDRSTASYVAVGVYSTAQEFSFLDATQSPAYVPAAGASARRFPAVPFPKPTILRRSIDVWSSETQVSGVPMILRVYESPPLVGTDDEVGRPRWRGDASVQLPSLADEKDAGSIFHAISLDLPTGERVLVGVPQNPKVIEGYVEVELESEDDAWYFSSESRAPGAMSPVAKVPREEARPEISPEVMEEMVRRPADGSERFSAQRFLELMTEQPGWFREHPIPVERHPPPRELFGLHPSSLGPCGTGALAAALAAADGYGRDGRLDSLRARQLVDAYAASLDPVQRGWASMVLLEGRLGLAPDSDRAFDIALPFYQGCVEGRWEPPEICWLGAREWRDLGGDVGMDEVDQLFKAVGAGFVPAALDVAEYYERYGEAGLPMAAEWAEIAAEHGSCEARWALAALHRRMQHRDAAEAWKRRFRECGDRSVEEDLEHSRSLRFGPGLIGSRPNEPPPTPLPHHRDSEVIK